MPNFNHIGNVKKAFSNAHTIGAVKFSPVKPYQAVYADGITDCRGFGVVIKGRDGEIKTIGMILSVSEHSGEITQRHRDFFDKEKYSDLELEQIMRQRNTDDTFPAMMAYTIRDMNESDELELYFLQGTSFYEEANTEFDRVEGYITELLGNSLAERTEVLVPNRRSDHFTISGNGKPFYTQQDLNDYLMKSLAIHRLYEQRANLPESIYAHVQFARKLELDVLRHLQSDLTTSLNMTTIYQKVAIQNNVSTESVRFTIMHSPLVHQDTIRLVSSFEPQPAPNQEAGISQFPTELMRLSSMGA